MPTRAEVHKIESIDQFAEFVYAQGWTDGLPPDATDIDKSDFAIGTRREQVVIATKFGFKISPKGEQIGLDSRPEHIKEVAEASLEHQLPRRLEDRDRRQRPLAMMLPDHFLGAIARGGADLGDTSVR